MSLTHHYGSSASDKKGTTSFLRSGGNVVQQQSSQNGTTNVLTGGPGEIFTRSDNSGVYSSLVDGLANALALTAASGAIQTEYSYGPFGETASSGPSSDKSIQYAGGENDGTGLQYDGNSYYSPEQQRFINEGSGSGISIPTLTTTRCVQARLGQRVFCAILSP